jgi:hypothetical protein
VSPPGGSAAIRTGGSTRTSQTTEQAIRAAHVYLAGCGIEIGPRKVNRLVRRFEARVLRNGWTFVEFLANSAQLSEEQRRQAIADPELACLLAYFDKVGETASRNVDREREQR